MPNFENPVIEETPNATEEIQAGAEQTTDTTTKLAEYIIGMSPEDPAIIDRLIEDQKIIRSKYGLPDKEVISPGEYEYVLRNLARSLGVTIQEKSECGNFFEEYSQAGAVNFDEEKKIGVSIDKNDLQAYVSGLNQLEHELIHSLQHERSPRMPVELMEYEAYIAGGNNELLREHPEMAKMVFEYLIGNSVKVWYDLESKKRGEKVKPIWQN